MRGFLPRNQELITKSWELLYSAFLSVKYTEYLLINYLESNINLVGQIGQLMSLLYNECFTREKFLCSVD